MKAVNNAVSAFLMFIITSLASRRPGAVLHWMIRWLWEKLYLLMRFSCQDLTAFSACQE
jgi:hypothetical protein